MHSNKLNHLGRKIVLAAALLFISGAVWAQSYIGNFSSFSAEGNTITVKAGKTSLRFILYKPNLVCVECNPAP